MQFTIFAVLMTLILSLDVSAQSMRASERLDSGWEKCVVENVDPVPPQQGWEAVKPPGREWLALAEKRQALWYRQEIEIPQDLGDKRLFIDLRAARYFPQVFVDGKPAGGGSDGWSPTRVEITSLVKPGARHQVSVRCLDRSSCFKPEFVYKSGMTDKELTGQTIVPVGGYKDLVGMTDRAYLKITPATFIDENELIISTSTRRQKLGLKGAVNGAHAGKQIEMAVLDDGKVVLEQKSIAVDEQGHFSLEIAFPNTRFWSPEDPHRYELRLTLISDGKIVDESTQKFGFKEVWAEGPDLYLNGIKRHFLASSTWITASYIDEAEVRKRLQQIKDCNTIAFRFHIGLWPEAWIEIADEIGLLTIDETAVYTDGSGMYAYRDPRFWDNFRKHIEGMIRRDRNHSSLAMWSIGNEILFMGAQKHDPDLPKKLGEAGRFAKSIDPSRPITFEADLDPDGAYDVIGLHYPHEMPWNRDYPNTTDWLATRKDTEAGGGMLGKQQGKAFYWDRKKPLYIGEYLWVPQHDYSCSSIWFGDEAFLNRLQYHEKARHLSWHDQTIGYRRAGVSGLTPWTAFGFGAAADPDSEIYLSQKDYYRPIAAYWKARGLRYFGGSNAELTFDVFNDSDRSVELELQLNSADLPVRKIEPVNLTLPPAGYQLVKLNVAIPKVDAETKFTIESTLLADGKSVHQEKRVCRAYPLQQVGSPAKRKLIILDPRGKWPQSLQSLNADTLKDPANTILLVAEDTFGEKQESQGELIRSFLRAGGRAIVLEQPTVDPLELGIRLVERPSTMTFPLSESHPILKGIERADLSYWGPTHYVTTMEIDRTPESGLSAITVSGGAEWTRFAGIAEMPVGQGRLVLIQSLAGKLRDTEPVAARIIQNAITSMDDDPPTRVPLAIIDPDKIATPVLEKMGVVLSKDSTDAELLMLAGSGDLSRNRSTIEGVLKRGGTVLVHATSAAAFASVRDVLGAGELEMVDAPVGVSLIAREHPLLRGVSREDVVSTTKVESWDRTMKHTPDAARGFLRVSLTPEVETLSPVEPDGKTCVTVRREKSGMYQIELDGEDSVAAPSSVMIRVNGNDVCWLKIAGNKPVISQLPLSEGESTIVLESLSSPGALKIRKVMLSRKPVLPDAVEALTAPPGLVTWKHGRGTVIVETVNWDHPWAGPSDPKRFLNALLQNLNCEFKMP